MIRLVAFMLMSLILFSATGCPDPHLPRNWVKTLVVTVIAADNKAPIQNATVTISTFLVRAPIDLSGTTDASGKALLESPGGFPSAVILNVETSSKFESFSQVLDLSLDASTANNTHEVTVELTPKPATIVFSLTVAASPVPVLPASATLAVSRNGTELFTSNTLILSAGTPVALAASGLPRFTEFEYTVSAPGFATQSGKVTTGDAESSLAKEVELVATAPVQTVSAEFRVFGFVGPAIAIITVFPKDHPESPVGVVTTAPVLGQPYTAGTLAGLTPDTDYQYTTNLPNFPFGQFRTGASGTTIVTFGGPVVFLPGG